MEDLETGDGQLRRHPPAIIGLNPGAHKAPSAWSTYRAAAKLMKVTVENEIGDSRLRTLCVSVPLWCNPQLGCRKSNQSPIKPNQAKSSLPKKIPDTLITTRAITAGQFFFFGLCSLLWRTTPKPFARCCAVDLAAFRPHRSPPASCIAPSFGQGRE
jgi:hypothetical protein